MWTLFQLRDKTLYLWCKIYERICSCGKSYIGETIRNVKTRRSEHNAPRDKSNPSKHLNENITNIFSWKVIYNAPKRKLTYKILETFFTTTMKPLTTKLSPIHYIFLEMEFHNFYITINISNKTIILICI